MSVVEDSCIRASLLTGSLGLIETVAVVPSGIGLRPSSSGVPLRRLSMSLAEYLVGSRTKLTEFETLRVGE